MKSGTEFTDIVWCRYKENPLFACFHGHYSVNHILFWLLTEAHVCVNKYTEYKGEKKPCFLKTGLQTILPPNLLRNQETKGLFLIDKKRGNEGICYRNKPKYSLITRVTQISVISGLLRSFA